MEKRVMLDGEYFPSASGGDIEVELDSPYDVGTRFTSEEGMTAWEILMLKANLTAAMEVIETQKGALDVAETSMQKEVDVQEEVIAAMMAEQEAIRQANLALEAQNESLSGLIDDVEIRLIGEGDVVYP